MDIVGDRNSFVLIGMAAVWVACVVFAAMRLLVTLRNGTPTPWWGNASGALAITALYFWYRRQPEARSSGAAHGTALVATLALLLPISYGMTSTIWWLSLVGFAMTLLGRRQEAKVWGVAIPLLVMAAVLAEPFVQIHGAPGERSLEAGLAKVVFVVLLVAMAAGFRRVAERRAVALHDSEARYRMLEAQLRCAHDELEQRVQERTEELRQSTRALSESEERYRLLFERNLAGVFRWTADGRVIDCNDACARIFGYDSQAQMLATPVAQFFETPQELADVFALLQREGQLLNHERSYRRKDGKTIWVIENISRTDGVIEGTLVDVTERRLLEEQFRQAQRMEAVGRLAGGIAHDFNNLLSAILSFSAFALAAVPEDSSLHDDLLEIHKAGERAASLTRQLLAFSRKQVLQPRVLDLNEVVRGLEPMLRRLLGENVELVTLLAQNLGRVKADPGQIEQVVMNLAVNARDAMPNGGKLVIETADIELDQAYAAQHAAARPGPHVLLSVTDSGHGMAEPTLARLFEPFFTTKGLGKGTGLGLATVYGIVKQSGGSIWVQSEPGRGTTFNIYLPRDLAVPLTAARPALLATQQPGTETILVVEDEESVRKLTQRILRGAGYTVLAAANGSDAMLTSERHEGPVHLLLTDVVMPQMSGRELAERLSQLRPTMRILYMSGYTDDAIVHHGVLEHGVHFIAKPFSATELRQKVRAILDEA